jgi:2-polyprenyl-6-methoxyphenol hydroxylase-like FAD-dependent oxidoreductase
MGLEERVRSMGTGEVGLRFVDDAGRSLAEFPVGAGGDGPTAELEILRGALARILVESCDEAVNFAYGMRIASVEHDEAAVTVSFTGGERRRYDLLVVAEGIRSTTRDMVFSGEPDYRDLGYYTAYCTIPRTADDDRWWRWYSAVGGRSVQLRPDNVGTTRACLNFPSASTGIDLLDRDAQVLALRDVYADVGNAAPRVLAGLAGDPASLYLDRIAQVRMPSRSRGRVAVLGDAAYCATPISGMGTSLALIGAYVLAGELAAHDDHTAGFRAYEKRMRPIVDQAQKLPPGVPRIANPTSRIGVWTLRRAVRVAAAAPVRALVARLSPAKTAARLPEYSC